MRGRRWRGEGGSLGAWEITGRTYASNESGGGVGGCAAGPLSQVADLGNHTGSCAWLNALPLLSCNSQEFLNGGLHFLLTPTPQIIQAVLGR